MKYVIWGAGHRGRILYELLGKDRIAAFIDSNPEKIGKSFGGCPIIDYTTYKERYISNIIIVSIVFGGGVTELLKKDHIFYFNIEKCPPEFMGYGLITAKKWIKNFHWNFQDEMVLYGGTLYTVLVYEKLVNEGYKNISILLPDTMNTTERTAFSERFPQIQVIQADKIKSQNIFLTEKKGDLETALKKSSVTDIVDWTQYIPDYRNNRIAALKNKYSGKRCFIVATGPSLTYEDLTCLHNHHEFCISMNSIFTCFSQIDWRPDCYTLLDADGILMWREQFDKLRDIPYKFIADCQPFYDYEQLDDSWYIYHSILDEFSIKNMLFSDDFSRKAYNGSTVTYVCIQLAVYLGFQEIYLLGVDYHYKTNVKSHFTEQEEPDDKFDGMNEQNRVLEVSYIAYQKAKSYALEHSIKICNATRKSCLDVFEKVDFESLFHDKATSEGK